LKNKKRQEQQGYVREFVPVAGNKIIQFPPIQKKTKEAGE